MKWALLLILTTLLFSVSAKDDNNMNNMINQLLNSKSLDGYWHIKTFPKRLPIVVSLPHDLDIGDAQIIKFNQPVVFTHKPSEHENVFSVKSYNKNDSNIVIEFSYAPEGIRGTAVYTEDRGDWMISDISITEQ